MSEWFKNEHWESMSEKSDAMERMSEWFKNEHWESMSEKSDAENRELLSKRSGGKSWYSWGRGVLMITLWVLDAGFTPGPAK